MDGYGQTPKHIYQCLVDMNRIETFDQYFNKDAGSHIVESKGIQSGDYDYYVLDVSWQEMSSTFSGQL